MMIIIREYFRAQMLNKADKSIILTIITCIMFILLELSVGINKLNISDGYSIFIFIALTLLPIISNNIVCTYIARKVGYKPNIFWLLVAGLYTVFIPIAPNAGAYVGSLIKLLFPIILLYNIYSFFQKRSKDVPISYIKKRVYVEIYGLAIFVFILAYFVSGLFRYYVVAVATGSMTPNIKVGDIVVIDQQQDYRGFKIGEVIAYKYNGIVVVHRLHHIVVANDEYYFYTKGDANDTVDNYTIYPNTILGVVKTKVPYIGLPTVWLNRLFGPKL